MGMEALVRVGPLFEDQVDPEVMNWIIDAEKHSFRILKWLLAFNFEKLFSFFNDKCYK